MNFESFVADGKDYRRAGNLLIKAIANQKTKPDETDCTSLLEDVLYEPENAYRGKTFVEARIAGGQFCGLAIYTLRGDDLFVDLLCSDCVGTGRLFIGELSRRAREAGKSFVRLLSVKDAIGFYTKTGFRPIGEPEDYGARRMELPLAGGGRRKTYRRHKSRKHGSTSLRRYKTRRVLSR